jgi:hypothetical protein
MSRDGSPSTDKSTTPQISSGHPASATICDAGIFIDDCLGKSAIGIVWSGRMIPEDGDDDDFTIPIAVKMAVPRENADPEADEDERDTIREEGLIYDYLAKSGTHGITPRYFGVFEDAVGTIALILENGGTALKTFRNLANDQ